MARGAGENGARACADDRPPPLAPLESGLPPSPRPDVAHGKGTPARALDIEDKAAEMRTVMARQ